MLAFSVTRQLIFDGLVQGLAIGLLGLGVVLVYRATRVINFAVGNMGLPGAVMLAILSVNYNFPFWIALAASLAIGVLFGVIIELSVVRRLFDAPRVILLVATIGVAQLATAIVTSFPEVSDPTRDYPTIIGTVWDDVAGVRIRGPQVVILVVVPLLAGALGWLLQRTSFGRTVTASAANAQLARLSGVSPKRVSTFVWAVAGLLSTVSLMLLSADAVSISGVANLGPSTLVRALAAAVIAGMVSFPRTIVAAAVIGITESVIKFNYLDSPGLIDFMLLAAVLIAVFLQSRSGSDEPSTFSFAPKIKPVPPRLLNLWWVRNFGRLWFGLAVVAAAVAPLIATESSRQLLYTTILCFALAALSVTVITGWGGQLSLGQMAFAGLGALFTAAWARGPNLDIAIGGTQIIDAQLKPIPLIAAILVAPLCTAAIAALLGLGALRVKGLLLAVSTFAFALGAQQYLYQRPFFTGDAGRTVPIDREVAYTVAIGGRGFRLDLGDQRSYYWFTLFFLAVVAAVLVHLRRSGVGRNTIAVRDNPDSAAAYTVGGTRTKLRAFALSGAIAGLAGALLAGALRNVPLNEGFFQIEDSLKLVSMAVIGGLSSVAGPIIGAVWVIGLPAFFPGNDLVPLFTSSIGLLVLLMYVPGGLVQVGYSIRDGLFAWVAKRLPDGEAPQPAVTVSALTGHRDRSSDADVADDAAGAAVEPVLSARDVSVSFGGITAVSDVSIEVGPNEVVGLIGTNGAGKSTLLNAIGGYVPAKGNVTLDGRDVSSKGAAARAATGFGRTFQAAMLFPELTVRETVLVALEGRQHTGLVSTAAMWPPALSVERNRLTESDEIIGFLGLGRYANSSIGELSTGTRRIVELAGLLALDAKLLCLDEPTAGVAQRETEAFGPLLLEIRRELGAAMLVIEHDMPLIMSISDRVVCLELGRVIASGTPEAVRDDPRVVSSYLGTDSRAVDRSDSVRVAPA